MKGPPAAQSRVSLIEMSLFALVSLATALAAITVLSFSTVFGAGTVIAFSLLIAVGVIFFVLSAIFAYEAYDLAR
jgi:hypothetical protein